MSGNCKVQTLVTVTRWKRCLWHVMWPTGMWRKSGPSKSYLWKQPNLIKVVEESGCCYLLYRLKGRLSGVTLHLRGHPSAPQEILGGTPLSLMLQWKVVQLHLIRPLIGIKYPIYWNTLSSIWLKSSDQVIQRRQKSAPLSLTFAPWHPQPAEWSDQPLSCSDWSEELHTPLGPAPISVLEFTFYLQGDAHRFHLRLQLPVPRLAGRCLTKRPSTPMSWPSPGLSWRRAGRPTAPENWPTYWTPSARRWKPSPLLSGRLASLTCEKLFFLLYLIIVLPIHKTFKILTSVKTVIPKVSKHHPGQRSR